jgi:hypothetical protein
MPLHCVRRVLGLLPGLMMENTGTGTANAFRYQAGKEAKYSYWKPPRPIALVTTGRLPRHGQVQGGSEIESRFGPAVRNKTSVTWRPHERHAPASGAASTTILLWANPSKAFSWSILCSVTVLSNEHDLQPA